jgi:hypothetical protein
LRGGEGGISWLAEKMSACQEGLRFVGLGVRPKCNIFERSRPSNLHE